jgi:hypothetical protein
LAAVNLDDWRNSGFKCERQKELKLYWIEQGHKPS